MPRLEPVMTATLPVRSNGVFFIAVSPWFLFLASYSEVMRRACPGHQCDFAYASPRHGCDIRACRWRPRNDG